jgi:aryl-alcohol dehydrogenase-like predicted oxidoreductase
MNYRPFGNTGLEVSEIGLGAFPISGMQKQEDGRMHGWTGVEDDESVALIHRAEEQGVNLIDSAESYGSGHSEVVTGKALKGRRDKWIVATKVTPNRGLEKDAPDEAAAKKRIREACEGSLKRLEMETIDLYQLHAIPHEWAMPAVMEELGKLKDEGKVRFYGISTNNQDAIEKLRGFGPADVLQIGYNLLERSADALLHWAKQEDIGTLIRVPLAKGMLTGKYFGENAQQLPDGDLRQERFAKPEAQEGLKKLPQLAFLQNDKRSMVQAALRFVLDHPGVSCAIAGAKNREQIDHNVVASEIPPLSKEDMDRALPIADTITTPGWIG